MFRREKVIALIMQLLVFYLKAQDVPAVGVGNQRAGDPRANINFNHTYEPDGNGGIREITLPGQPNSQMPPVITAHAFGANNAVPSPNGTFTLAITPTRLNGRLATTTSNTGQWNWNLQASDLPAPGSPDEIYTFTVTFTHAPNGNPVTAGPSVVGTVTLRNGGPPPPPPPPPPSSNITGWSTWRLKSSNPPPIKIPIPLANHSGYTKGPYFLPKRRLHLRTRYRQR